MAYEELPQSPDEEPQQPSKSHYARRYRHTVWVLILSAMLNVILSGWVVQLFWDSEHGASSYEDGFVTDLEGVKSSIGLVQLSFNGGVKLDKDGNFIKDEKAGARKYTGKPSPFLDLAWYELLLGLNIDLSGSDADGLADHTFQWPNSETYFSGLEVFHSLHCLNRLRQALHPEYYTSVFKNPNDPSKEDHIDHCIEHLRQAVQCHADLTPMHWARVNGDDIILKTDTMHTCRDFNSIWNWAKSRSAVNNKWIANATFHIVD